MIIKTIFLRWIFLLVVLAFLITVFASYKIHSALARTTAEDFLRLKIEDAEKQVRENEKKIALLTEINNETGLSKARAFATIIKKDPKILKNQKALDNILEILDVDELNVSDEKGILIASTNKQYINYDMSSDPQSAAFIPAITDKNFELAQEPRPNGILKILFQYIGVARKDYPGIIQIGIHPKRLEETKKIANIASIEENFRIGNKGTLSIRNSDEGETIKTERIFTSWADNDKSLCMSVQYNDYIITGSLPYSEMYVSRNSIIKILIIGNLILFGVIFLLISRLLQKVVINGISSVNSSLSKIKKGNLDEVVNVKNCFEFIDLSNGINATVDSLKLAIEKEAKRIDADLELGKVIQASALSTKFPKTEHFKLNAIMNPAKEIGGDFYDFFEIDENKFAFLVADVSGKGLGAALYMMTAKTLLKDCILHYETVAEAFTKANLELATNNKAKMFVTVFCIVWDKKLNTITCVNAGHNPPLIKRQNSLWEYLRMKPNMVVGASKKTKYAQYEFPFELGDEIYLYTDGVTEAMNDSNEQFGEERLINGLNSLSNENILDEIAIKIKQHTQNTPQSDDITMMILETCKELTEQNPPI